MVTSGPIQEITQRLVHGPVGRFQRNRLPIRVLGILHAIHAFVRRTEFVICLHDTGITFCDCLQLGQRLVVLARVTIQTAKSQPCLHQAAVQRKRSMAGLFSLFEENRVLQQDVLRKVCIAQAGERGGVSRVQPDSALEMCHGAADSADSLSAIAATTRRVISS